MTAKHVFEDRCCCSTLEIFLGHSDASLNPGLANENTAHKEYDNGGNVRVRERGSPVRLLTLVDNTADY